MSKLALLSSCIALALTSGCVSQRYVTFTANTEPPGAWVYESGKPQRSYAYRQPITEEDRSRGRVDLPTLVFEKPGFEKYYHRTGPIILKDGKNQGRSWGNAEKVYLERDPSWTPSIKNQAALTINTEPQGARVYAGGRYMGVSPLTLNYTLERQNYSMGEVRCEPIIAVADGFRAARQDPRMELRNEWRWQEGQKYPFATLILLERDPSAPRVTESRVTVSQEKDAIDTLLGVGQIGVLLKSLR
jgi:hypothetical protein